MNFPVELAIGSSRYKVKIDAPDYESAIYEMKNLCKDVCSKLSILKATSVNPGSFVMVEGICLGYQYESVTGITPEFIKRVKDNQKTEEKAPTMIDLESVKNDIQIVISMFRTLAPDTWMTVEPIVFLYHILNKHYGDPMPEEIEKAKSRVRMTEEQG